MDELEISIDNNALREIEKYEEVTPISEININSKVITI